MERLALRALIELLGDFCPNPIEITSDTRRSSPPRQKSRDVLPAHSTPLDTKKTTN